MKMVKTVLLLVASACGGSVMAGMSIEEWCQALRDQEAAIRRGDWQQAAVYSAKASAGNDVTGFIPVNYVNNCLVGVLCGWNFEGVEKRSENCKVLQACVDVCENKIAKGCGARLAEFQKKMKAGELDGIKFTANDMLSSVGLVEYLLEEPRSAADANHAKKMAQLNRLMMQIDAATDVYRKEGEWHATQAKFAASMEYQQKHHKTFDPNNRPPKDSASREDWDSCKRIYDIFSRDSVSSSTTTSTTSSYSTTKPRRTAFTEEQREAAKAVISRASPTSSGSLSVGRTSVQTSKAVANDTLPEAKKCFAMVDQSFDAIMSKSATEVRLAPGDDLAAAIANATGRTTIRLQAGRYVLTGDKESCSISGKIRIFGEGRGKTVIAGNITVKSGESISLVLKDLTLTGPTETKDGKVNVEKKSLAAFDNVELKCIVDVESNGVVLGRRVRQLLKDSRLSRNSFSIASRFVFKDSTFKVAGFDAGCGSCVAFEKCSFAGKKHSREVPNSCFSVYGDYGGECVPYYLSGSLVEDYDLVFQSVTSTSNPRKNGLYMNDVLLKSCTAIVDGGTCKAYGLRMMDMEADDSSVVKVSEPLDIPSSWSEARQCVSCSFSRVSRA